LCPACPSKINNFCPAIAPQRLHNLSTIYTSKRYVVIAMHGKSDFMGLSEGKGIPIQAWTDP